MKKLTFFILGTFLFFVTPFVLAAQEQAKTLPQEQQVQENEYQQQQGIENKEFRETSEAETPQEKASAIKEHRETQQGENKAFNEKMRQENSDFLKQRLAKNNKLTDTEKNELIGYFENQYQGNVSFREQKRNDNVVFFEHIVNNPRLTLKQKKAAIKAHFDVERAKTKEHN